MSSTNQTQQDGATQSTGTSPLYMQSAVKKQPDTALQAPQNVNQIEPVPAPTADSTNNLDTPIASEESPTLKAEYGNQVESSENQKLEPEANTATETANSNLNVNSIISEIKDSLDNELDSSEIVEEKVESQPTAEASSLVASQAQTSLPQEDVAEAPNTLPQKNIVTYNLNAQDTFQENYQNQIEINKPVNVASTIEGIKEIKPIESGVPFQVVQDITQPKDLQYKTYALEDILREAIERKASDVHFTVGYRATFRVDGELKTFNSQLLSSEDVKKYAQAIVAHRKDIVLDNIKEVDLTYTLEGKRFRVNIFKQLSVYSIVCRVINESILSLDNLGLPITLSSLTNYPNGLIIVTGPTGSGKSTTLASMLNNVNLSSSKHIVTLEDPVEYILPKGLSVVDQREYGTDFMSWPNALRSVLRQDPDIVLIGEMRDMESIEAALQVAETGHLVFATLHTNSAAQSIDRIIDVFPAEKQSQIRMQLASVIRAIVSQRLIPLAKGGRQPAVEVVLANTAVQNAIREGKVFLIDNVIQTSAEEGMISLEKSLVQMVKEGKVSAQTAKSYSLKPNEIDLLLNK